MRVPVSSITRNNMKIKLCLALGMPAALLLTLPFPAAAQQIAQGIAHQGNVLDAGAAVPALAYVSAFKTYQAASDERTSPDQVWRTANESVGKSGSHAAHSHANGEKPAMVKPLSAAELSSSASSRTLPMPSDHSHMDHGKQSHH
jgi:hypothetical protein